MTSRDMDITLVFTGSVTTVGITLLCFLAFFYKVPEAKKKFKKCNACGRWMPSK